MQTKWNNGLTPPDAWTLPDSLYLKSGPRGSYNPLQFVVRLRADIRDLLNSIQEGVFSSEEISEESIFAFSTYFHEMTHWWQHIGTTTGLMLSFAYPAQCHVNLPHLRRFSKAVGPQKSIKSFANASYDGLDQRSKNECNIILNNWHDVAFNSSLILNPVGAESDIRNPFFESVGHSLRMSLEHTIWLLGASVDPDLSFLPDVRNWSEAFQDLRRRKVEGYYFGSPVRLVPLGAIQIFEGQARFHQIQYIYLASRRRCDWEYFRNMGMFGAVYIGAFQKFLEWTESEWPDSPIAPIVQLFLLVCDLSLNPSEGYPFPLRHFESFIISNDPSYRFYWMSRQIARNPSLKTAISDVSADIYREIGVTLCKSLTCATPLEIASELCRWIEKEESIQDLLAEERTFAFRNANLPVNVIFAKHLRFAQDRIARPEFFCWPAMYFVGGDNTTFSLNESLELLNRHQPLYYASFDDEIRPVLIPGRSADNVQQTFNDFYRWNLLYDIVRQWVIVDGTVDYDYRWLTPRYTQAEVKPWIDQTFFEAFGFHPDQFILF